MILAVDVHYPGDGTAIAAGVMFKDWHSDTVEQVVTHHVEQVAPYRPGFFFERELPCILALMSKLDAGPEAVIIDGYVWLGTDHRLGLGAHLHVALQGALPVIGVAKTRFHETPPGAEVIRGLSARPLFVTAVGIDAETAKISVRSMHGQFRMPTMLSEVDRACRLAIQAADGT
jgi:deoxyribonuclease V